MMLRAFHFCAVFMCMFIGGAFAYSQDDQEVVNKIANRIAKWNEIRRDILLQEVQSTNCRNCHQGVGKQVTNFLTKEDGLNCGEYRISDLDDSLLRTHLRLKEKPALVVVKAPTNKAGSVALEQGDVLLATNDEPIENAIAFRTKMDRDPKAKVQIKLLREGKAINQTVQASELGTPPKVYRIGVRVETPNEAIRSQLNLGENEGLLVTEVLDEAGAKGTGLEVHDILLRTNETRLSSFEDLRATVNNSQGDAIEVTLVRKGKEIRIKVKPYEAPEPISYSFQVDTDEAIRVWLECPAQNIYMNKSKEKP